MTDPTIPQRVLFPEAPDLDRLQAAAAEVKRRLAEHAGVYEVNRLVPRRQGGDEARHQARPPSPSA